MSARRAVAGVVNSGRPWTPEEESKMLAALRGGASLEAVAKSHERTEGAITARQQHAATKMAQAGHPIEKIVEDTRLTLDGVVALVKKAKTAGEKKAASEEVMKLLAGLQAGQTRILELLQGPAPKRAAGRGEQKTVLGKLEQLAEKLDTVSLRLVAIKDSLAREDAISASFTGAATEAVIGPPAATEAVIGPPKALEPDADAKAPGAETKAPAEAPATRRTKILATLKALPDEGLDGLFTLLSMGMSRTSKTAALSMHALENSLSAEDCTRLVTGAPS
jgi:uncharacterized protein YukE